MVLDSLVKLIGTDLSLFFKADYKWICLIHLLIGLVGRVPYLADFIAECDRSHE